LSSQRAFEHYLLAGSAGGAVVAAGQREFASPRAVILAHRLQEGAQPGQCLLSGGRIAREQFLKRPAAHILDQSDVGRVARPAPVREVDLRGAHPAASR